MAEVWLRAPPARLFDFPPAPIPPVLPSPQQAPSFYQPFNINPELYNAALDFRVPITIASVYAVTVTILNAVNRRRNHKPWAISKTRLFFALVIAHNVFLAVYSAWTHVGMIRALYRIMPDRTGDSFSVAEYVDAFCQMQGPRGLGDAVSYDHTGSTWAVRNPLIKLQANKPDPTDVGRLWNEGLAFYGWLFYISKFYEVIDTLVILAKGKRSSFLQTYHHAGAMLCMWAGIRYMSPPIWMFCFLNSLIHALMYTYYTLSALGIKVPGALKRLLTTAQIMQFIVGFGFAIMHLFIAYKIPIQSPYVYYHNLSTALPSATSIVAGAAASADVGSWLKKIVLRAAGDESLSSNVRNRNGNLFGHSGEQAVLAESNVLNKAREEVRYRLEYAGVSCIDTSGQAFAIYLNLLYLLPLTMLFTRFFIKSYLRRPGGKLESEARRWSKSGYDAAKGVEKEVVKAMRRDRGSALTSPVHSDVEPSSPNGSSRKHKNKLSMTKITDQVNEKAENLVSKGVNGVKNLSKKAEESDIPANLKNSANKAVDSAKEFASNLQKKAENAAKDTNLAANVKDTANKAVDSTKQAANDIQDKAKNTAKNVESELKQAKEESITDSSKEHEDSGEAVKSPSKKKRRNKNKNQDHSQAHLDSSSHEAESYAEAAAKPPSTNDNDVVAGEGERVVVDLDEGSGDPLAQSYETSIDEITTDEQKEAEAKMQPDALYKS